MWAIMQDHGSRIAFFANHLGRVLADDLDLVIRLLAANRQLAA